MVGSIAKLPFFMAFLAVEKIKVKLGIEPAMSRSNFSRFVEPTLAEMGQFR